MDDSIPGGATAPPDGWSHDDWQALHQFVRLIRALGVLGTALLPLIALITALAGMVLAVLQIWHAARGGGGAP